MSGDKATARTTRLYLITPPALPNIKQFAGKLEDAFSGGDIACLQLRLKDAADDEVLAAAKTLIPICHRHNAAFILNDRPDLAIACGADGVHLGQDDVAHYGIDKTKEMLGEDRVLGVSCHDSRHMAMEAGELGADYVAFGSVFPSQTKETAPPVPLSVLEDWVIAVKTPCVAIGGITAQNCAPLVQMGVEFVAVIGQVWNHPDGAVAGIKELQKEIELNKKTA